MHFDPHVTTGQETANEAADGDSSQVIELSVVMPCLNEAETLAVCIEKAQRAMREHGISGEVVIADNGSTDGSPEIARRAGARVVPVAIKGYGAALMGAINAARGTYVIMGDADDSYDFLHIPRFVDKLREGYDLAMGNRFRGGIAPGAMPPLHRYLGNPVLSGIGRVFFRSPCGDFHCGLRGFSRQAILDLDLRTTGMEFASEMVVKATIHKLKIAEVPTTLSPDGRSRAPHLRSWRDGWRHLRFMWLYSPRWLFLYPGLALMLVGMLLMLWLLPSPRTVGPLYLNVHTLLYSAAAVLVGFQAVLFAVLSKVFAISRGLLPEDPLITRFNRRFRLEFGLLAGGALVLGGLAASVFAVAVWGRSDFGSLDPSSILRIAVPAVTALVLGCQTVMASFFLSLLWINHE